MGPDRANIPHYLKVGYVHISVTLVKVLRLALEELYKCFYITTPIAPRLKIKKLLYLGLELKLSRITITVTEI